MLVHQVEHAGNAFVVAVSEEAVGRGGGHAVLDLVGDHAAGPRDRLAATLEHKREAHRQPSAVRPEAGCIAGGTIYRCRCSLRCTRQAAVAGSNRKHRGRTNGPKGLTASKMEIVASRVNHWVVLSVPAIYSFS